MGKHIVAGNWKMNNNLAETEVLISSLKLQSNTGDAEVMVAPTFTNLSLAVKALKD